MSRVIIGPDWTAEDIGYLIALVNTLNPDNYANAKMKSIIYKAKGFVEDAKSKL